MPKEGWVTFASLIASTCEERSYGEPSDLCKWARLLRNGLSGLIAWNWWCPKWVDLMDEARLLARPCETLHYNARNQSKWHRNYIRKHMGLETHLRTMGDVLIIDSLISNVPPVLQTAPFGPFGHLWCWPAGIRPASMQPMMDAASFCAKLLFATS